MERLIKYFVPERYDLDLAFNKDKKTFVGTAWIFGEAKSKTIKFHAVNMEIINILIQGSSVEDLWVMGGEDLKYEVKDGILAIHDIPKGRIMIDILYEANLNTNMQGCYLSTYEYRGKEEKIIATQFESHYAREAFPCIDEPEAKAVFNLTITLPPTNKDIVISNMPEDAENMKQEAEVNEYLDWENFGYRKIRRELGNPLDDDKRRVMFETTPRMSTYLLAWVIGPLRGKRITNKHGVKITTYTTLAQDLDSVDYANEIAARSLEFYDDNFGIKYPLPKLDQVALPDFEAGAMENWGLVTYRETMMLVSRVATLGTKKSVALTVSHELSHQWFGDLVTMKWWDDLWLNESFASIMEYYATDHIHPEYQIFEGFFTRDCYSALIRDAYTDVQSVHQDVDEPSEIATLFDSAIVYSKGAHLMLMLIRLMGWKKFCQGCRDYFKKHQYHNTVGDDLWDALNKHADFNVKKLMHSFIDKPGYPVFTSNQASVTGQTKATSKSNTPKNTASSKSLAQVSASKITEKTEVESKHQSIWQNAKQKRFLLDGKMQKSDWPVPEVTEDMSGHYILNLSDEEFNARLEKFDDLTLEEKLRLLIDKSLATRTDLAKSETIVPLAWKFRNENSAAVWNIVSALIGNLKVFFADDTPEDKMLKKYVKDLVTPKLTEIGLITRKDDDENILRLRAILTGLDFYAEDIPNLQKLADMYTTDYKNMDPEIRDDILDAKIYLEPKKIDDYLWAYQNIVDPEIKFDLLYAGTVSKNQKVLEKLMELLEQPDIVKPQDQLYLFIYLYRNDKISKKVFTWMTENWYFIADMMGEKTMDSYPRYTANLMRTEKDLKKYQKFFTPKKSDPVLKRAIEIGEKEIKARIKLIADDQEGVKKALEKWAKVR